jgi:hypothetical protein
MELIMDEEILEVRQTKDVVVGYLVVALNEVASIGDGIEVHPRDGLAVKSPIGGVGLAIRGDKEVGLIVDSLSDTLTIPIAPKVYLVSSCKYVRVEKHAPPSSIYPSL